MPQQVWDAKGLKNLATAGAAEDQRRKVTLAAFQTEWRRSLKR